MVKGILFRLDKPTGEALIAGDDANYKSSAPAGQASKGALGRWVHPSMLDGALQTLNVNGWVASLVHALHNRIRYPFRNR